MPRDNSERPFSATHSRSTSGRKRFRGNVPRDATIGSFRPEVVICRRPISIFISMAEKNGDLGSENDLTVMSMIKRRQGAAVRGATYGSQCRELRLMALTHNVMILLFY